MNGMALAHTNGSKRSQPDYTWMQQSVCQFFGHFNWNDNPPEVQELRQTASTEPQSFMTLTVKQFFAAIDWDGNAIATPPPSDSAVPAKNPVDAFTLEDFSDLF